MASRQRSKGRNRARRKARLAKRMGLSELSKDQLDAMHEVALSRFGVGIGVIVQEQHRHERLMRSHQAQRDALDHNGLSFGRLWPWSRWWRLRRAAAAEGKLAAEWDERLRAIAADVATNRPELIATRGQGPVRWPSA